MAAPEPHDGPKTDNETKPVGPPPPAPSSRASDPTLVVARLKGAAPPKQEDWPRTGAPLPTAAVPPKSESETITLPPPSEESLPAGKAPSSVQELPAAERRSVVAQDLSEDKLILAAPRLLAEGRPAPALGGIPLLAKLGQGGMGAVYYGMHPRLQKEVAVKVLPFHLAEQDPQMIRRFYREAQVSAQVESPHLVRVLDVNEECGLYYLVMEFVRGASAGGYLEQLQTQGFRGLPESVALDVCVATVKGLLAAHAKGIVHRDVKPDNILIPTQAETSDVLDFAAAKLSDLGLARRQELGRAITVSNAVMGSPGYMAPEQIEDSRGVGPAADIFAIGASLYALLAGVPPFRGRTAVQALMRTAQEPHVGLRSFRPDVSTATAALVDKCLEKDPARRFASARELLAALRNCRAPLAENDPRAGSGTLVDMRARIPGKGGPSSRVVPLPSATEARASGPRRARWVLSLGLAAALALGFASFLWWSRSQSTPSGPVPQTAWQKAEEDARKAEPDLTQADAVYAAYLAACPNDGNAQEAQSRRADLARRLTEARNALIGNVPLAYSAKEKKRWAEIVTLLDGPLQAIGKQEHPSRQVAAALLADARGELQKRAAYDAKLKEAEGLLSAGAAEAALAAYQQARGAAPEGETARAEDGVKLAEAALRDRRYKQELEAGRKALADQDWGEAEKRFQAALKEKDGDAQARDGLAKAQGGSLEKRFREALTEGEKLRARQPEADWEGARKQFALAVELRGNDPQATARLAEAESWLKLKAAELARGEKRYSQAQAALREAETRAKGLEAPVLQEALGAATTALEQKRREIGQAEDSAREAERLGQADRALKAYQELKETNPEEKDKYEEAARLLQTKRGFQESLDAGDAQRQTGNYAAARQAYQAALEQKKDAATRALIEGRLKEVEAGELIQKGRKSAEAKDWDRAQEAYTSAEKTVPPRAADLVTLLQDSQKALQAALSRAAGLERDAQAAQNAGEWARARTLWGELAGFYPAKREACDKALADVEARLKAQGDAVAQREKAQAHLADAQQKLAKGDPKGAEAAVRAALTLEPGNAQAKLLLSEIEFTQSFGADTIGQFDRPRAHIGQLILNGRYQEAETALRKCTAEQERLNLLVAQKPDLYMPEEVAGLKTAALECQTMAGALAPFVKAGQSLNGAQARLRAGLDLLAPLPAGAAPAREELCSAQKALTGLLADAAKAFANRNYFEAQNSAGTIGGKFPTLAQEALTRAATALEQQARKEAGAEADRYTTAAKGLRGL